MNPEEFEQALMRDIASASRHDPTPDWKADILARAAAPTARKTITFSRLVVLAWAACWIVSLVLYFMTPASEPDRLARVSSPVETPWRAIEAWHKSMSALLASNDANSSPRP
jgi:hypothetical protein